MSSQYGDPVDDYINKVNLRYLLEQLIEVVRSTPPEDSYDIGWDEGSLGVIHAIAKRFNITLGDTHE